MSYFYIFMQSNLLEMPVYLMALWRFRDQRGWGGLILLITAMNAATHPLVYFGFMNLPLTYLQNILMAEIFAISAETVILRKAFHLSKAPAAGLCIAANLLSWQVAPALTYLIFGD